MTNDITQHDAKRRRCPMLGHEVPFSYCRQPGRDLPCGKIFDCWWEQFDVSGFLREHLTAEQIGCICQPRKDKALTLVELIEKARRASEESD